MIAAGVECREAEADGNTQSGAWRRVSGRKIRGEIKEELVCEHGFARSSLSENEKSAVVEAGVIGCDAGQCTVPLAAIGAPVHQTGLAKPDIGGLTLADIGEEFLLFGGFTLANLAGQGAGCSG